MKRQKVKALKPKSEPPLKMKQLKAVHFLIAASCYISILESSQDNIRNIREMSGKFYHGDGEDVLGKAQDFLLGKFRFKVLWTDTFGEMSSVVSNGYGHLSGASRGSIKQVMCQSTLSGGNILDGRSIIKKAKSAIAECKILLSFWMGFWLMGIFQVA